MSEYPPRRGVAGWAHMRPRAPNRTGRHIGSISPGLVSLAAERPSSTRSDSPTSRDCGRGAESPRRISVSPSRAGTYSLPPKQQSPRGIFLKRRIIAPDLPRPPARCRFRSEPHRLRTRQSPCPRGRIARLQAWRWTQVARRDAGGAARISGEIANLRLRRGAGVNYQSPRSAEMAAGEPSANLVLAWEIKMAELRLCLWAFSSGS